MAEHPLFAHYDPGDLPGDFRNALDDAAALCKRNGNNLVGLPHLLAALLRRMPAAVADVFALEPEAIRQRVQPVVEAGEFVIPGNSVRIDQSIADLVDSLQGQGLLGAPAYAGAFVRRATERFPWLRAWLAAERNAAAADFITTPTDAPGSGAAGAPSGMADTTAGRSGPRADAGATAAPSPTPGVRGDDGRRGVTGLADGDGKRSDHPAPPRDRPADATGSKAEDGSAGGASGRGGSLPPPRPRSRIPYLVDWDDTYLQKAPSGLFGRELEVRKLTTVLLRRDDPVAILSGPAGSGKTSLLLSLARQAANGTIPAFAGYRFASLDLPTVLGAGTTGVLNQAKFAETIEQATTQDRLIVVIEDVHLLLGLGGPPLLHDFAACLRPFLLRGSLRAVFTTQPRLFDRMLGPEPVFGNRTTLINLQELAGEALHKTVGAAVVGLFAHHQVTITPEAVAEAVRLGSEQQRDLRPPAACIRLLDGACVEAKLAADPRLTAEVVRALAASQDDLLATAELRRLRQLEAELSRWVVGQDEAIRAVAQRVRLTKLQLDRKPQRPDGVFLFLGPSGVGKTELAKALTHCLYGDLARLVRLDMSEFMWEHEYSKIIGAPPGFVGHGDEGHLTGPVARLGHAVVLLDEVEKAHPSVLRLFLQLFDEGFLTDGKGKRVDFSHTVVIMTSNLGRELYSTEHKTPLGFHTALPPSEPKAQAVLNYLLKVLPSEFVNRIDVLVPFRALDPDDLRGIARRMLGDEVRRWSQRGKELTFDDELVDLLTRRGYDPRLGARHLTRNLEELLNQRVSEAACGEEWPAVRRVRLRVVGEQVRLEVEAPIRPAPVERS